jgi:uncharacterized protein YkwD
MPARTRTRGRRLVAVVVAVTVAVALGITLAPPAVAGEGYRAKLLRLLNASRENHDLRPLTLNGKLSADAAKHSRTMLRKNRVYDPPNLAEMLAPYPYDDLGAAAAGCDGTLKQVHRAFLASPAHREILLHPDLRRVGIGVVKADEANLCGKGSFWVTEVFYG